MISYPCESYYFPSDHFKPEVYPDATPLGDRIVMMYQQGVTPDLLADASYDVDDDSDIDPSSNIREDRFDLYESAVVAGLLDESLLPPVTAPTPVAAPSEPDTSVVG